MGGWDDVLGVLVFGFIEIIAQDRKKRPLLLVILASFVIGVWLLLEALGRSSELLSTISLLFFLVSIGGFVLLVYWLIYDALRDAGRKHELVGPGKLGPNGVAHEGVDELSAFDRLRGGGGWLKGANLERANLQEADLQGAELTSARLNDANLRQADLRHANLQNADLRGAILWNANLQAANLQGANLRGASLWGAKFDRYTILVRGQAWTPDTDLTRFGARLDPPQHESS